MVGGSLPRAQKPVNPALAVEGGRLSARKGGGQIGVGLGWISAIVVPAKSGAPLPGPTCSA